MYERVQSLLIVAKLLGMGSLSWIETLLPTLALVAYVVVVTLLSPASKE